MDDALREVEIPVALEKLLKKEGLMPFFEGLSFPSQRVLPVMALEGEGGDADEAAGRSDGDTQEGSSNPGIGRRYGGLRYRAGVV